MRHFHLSVLVPDDVGVLGGDLDAEVDRVALLHLHVRQLLRELDLLACGKRVFVSS